RALEITQTVTVRTERCVAAVFRTGQVVFHAPRSMVGRQMRTTLGAWEPGSRPGVVVDAKVLIVDDEPANVAILSRMMGRLGYTTVTAADGEAGLAAVIRERPDVVLLDVNMPRLDGFEVCQRLKSD